jgi:hypothetical protein
MRLFQPWKSHGGIGQPAVGWNTVPWKRTLPEFGGLFDRLPNPINRDHVRARAQQADDEPACREAFVAAMVWGYGRVGYGPYRTARVLCANPAAGATLRVAAALVRSEGGPAAFSWLAGHRLRYLGVAFATKYLHFADDGQGSAPALILDRLVRDWLREHAGCRVSLAWDVDGYRHYVETVERWAAGLGASPSQVEYLMFADAASGRSPNQWSDVPWLGEDALSPDLAGEKAQPVEVTDVLDALDEAAELFATLPGGQVPADVDDFECGIRQLRRIVLARVSLP